MNSPRSFQAVRCGFTSLPKIKPIIGTGGLRTMNYYGKELLWQWDKQAGSINQKSSGNEPQQHATLQSLEELLQVQTLNCNSRYLKTTNSSRSHAWMHTFLLGQVLPGRSEHLRYDSEEVVDILCNVAGGGFVVHEVESCERLVHENDAIVLENKNSLLVSVQEYPKNSETMEEVINEISGINPCPANNADPSYHANSSADVMIVIKIDLVVSKKRRCATNATRVCHWLLASRICRYNWMVFLLNWTTALTSSSDMPGVMATMRRINQ